MRRTHHCSHQWTLAIAAALLGIALAACSRPVDVPDAAPALDLGADSGADAALGCSADDECIDAHAALCAATGDCIPCTDDAQCAHLSHLPACASGTCVACRAPADCPPLADGPVAACARGVCVACITDADCPALFPDRPVCTATGCVPCDPAAPGLCPWGCDVASRHCWPAPRRACESCRAATDCASGLDCVAQVWPNGATLEHGPPVCLPRATSSSECATMAPYGRAIPSAGGALVCAPVTSCAALAAFGADCRLTCDSFVGAGDTLCVWDPAGFHCSIPCTSPADCPPPTTCGPTECDR